MLRHAFALNSLLGPCLPDRSRGLQVTPILGMLSLIQAERLCVHKGKLPCVQMVWASRNAGDFLLLDPSLVEEARYSMLHAGHEVPATAWIMLGSWMLHATC